MPSDSDSEQGEPDFEEDLEEMQEAVNDSLRRLTDVKAYVLTGDDLQDFKAAQYALRNLSSDKTSDHDVEGVYR